MEGIGKKLSTTFQKELMEEKFSQLPFDKELVNLVDYKLVYKIIENAGDGEIYFGHQVAQCRPHDAAKNKNHDDTFHSKYSLKKRPYLGPTSTDHELAFLMANQGQVRPGDFVYDPFVGTGSIATALQHFQSFTFGSDLDIRVIKGYGVGRKTKNDIAGLDKIKKFDILTNFKHYGLPQPDFWVQDINTPMIRRHRPTFDSIVCDPPYGVRARTQCVGVSDTRAARKQEKQDREELKKQAKASEENKEEVKGDSSTV